MPAADTVSWQQQVITEGAPVVAAAQQAGQAERVAMLAAYESDIKPLGSAAGAQPVLPVLPDNAVPPASSGLYPYAGDEPVA
jgi:hypothetical protein